MPDSSPTRSTHKSVLETHRTLILGGDDQPLGWPRLFLNAKQTMTLLALGRADVSDDDDNWWSDDFIMGVKQAYRLPNIVRMKEYNQHMFASNIAAFNQFNLYLRDEGTCQYEGTPVYWKTPEIDDRATMDHVIPASVHGEKTWENILLASHKANCAKRNRTPEEWGRQPINRPYVPTNAEILYLHLRQISVERLTPFVVSLLNTIRPSSFLVNERQAKPLALQAA